MVSIGGMEVLVLVDCGASANFMMSAYFCPHLMFNSGYLVEFVCLKIDLIGISYYWVY